MPMKNLQIASLASGAGLALIAAMAISATLPSTAKAAPASALSVAQEAAPTDLSAARRHHQARRSAPRNAFGSMGNSYEPSAPSYQGFGYGSGDNSRGQTW